MNETEKVAREIMALYEIYGDADYIGEPVSQLEHMCQCAQLAQRQGYNEEVILAAFFHDIGHLCEHITTVQQMDGFGVVDHERMGAEFLRSRGFSENIARLVENHVQAKRYLTFQSPAYYDQLSEASRQTLVFQGGRMTAEEAAAFEKDELFELHIQVRRWDEQAKQEDLPIPDLKIFEEMIIRHLGRKIPLKQ